MARGHNDYDPGTGRRFSTNGIPHGAIPNIGAKNTIQQLDTAFPTSFVAPNGTGGQSIFYSFGLAPLAYAAIQIAAGNPSLTPEQAAERADAVFMAANARMIQRQQEYEAEQKAAAEKAKAEKDAKEAAGGIIVPDEA